MRLVLKILNKIIDISGWICVAALMLMIGNVFLDVFVRYIFVDLMKAMDLYTWYDSHISWFGGIGMQELEWHWFSIVFLLGMGYTLKEDGHVRVDVFYDNFSPAVKSIINIIGTLIFTIPFCGLVAYYSWGYFEHSYQSGENIGNPGSLPRLWPIKLLLPIAFGFVVLSAITVMLKEIISLCENKQKAPQA
ncbi:MAG: C4-dicarboxylate ABC transporter [Micavibrio sp.]|nr:C4-dicarboxylate ABC transporter [Micavibrio sp.]|tara:strand:+ start:725 stop:1297 length:573 start_codon:yes stop_codon:yes gene_type:complete